MPLYNSAIVPIEKITDYLLSESHPRGSMKAVWFNRLGFELADPERLIEALVQHASLEVNETTITEYGTKYTILGKLLGPSGDEAQLCSVWIIRIDDSMPRFVTAYPDK